MRLAPSAAKPSLFFRFFHRNRDQFSELYRDAELDYSGGARLFDLIPGDVISDQIAFNGFYELALTRRLARMAERGGLFVDVGANVGYFSILWVSLNAGSRAVCFEASPRNVDMLRSNIRRNGLGARISLIAKAAGKERGTTAFSIGPPGQTGWGGIAGAGASDAGHGPGDPSRRRVPE